MKLDILALQQGWEGVRFRVVACGVGYSCAGFFGSPLGSKLMESVTLLSGPAEACDWARIQAYASDLSTKHPFELAADLYSVVSNSVINFEVIPLVISGHIQDLDQPIDEPNFAYIFVGGPVPKAWKLELASLEAHERTPV